MNTTTKGGHVARGLYLTDSEAELWDEAWADGYSARQAEEPVIVDLEPEPPEPH